MISESELKYPDMKKLVFILALIGFPLSSFCQVTILQGTYRTFDGRSIDTYIIEGAKTVVYIEETSITEDQLADLETIKDIVDNIDFYYNYYTEFFGTEPAGGDPNFSYKSPVAFVPPSCGAACGLVGSKGIEVSPGMFCQIFNERKYQIGTNRIGIVGYEFGRNFFVDGSKMLLPYSNPEDRNGGFAEGFAGFPAILAHMAYCKTQDPSFSMFQETLLNYDWLLDSFRAFINDLSSSPYKQLAKENFIFDINRSMYGNYYGVYGGALVVGIYDTFKDDIDFSVYFNTLRDRNNVVTIEDALGNIAYSYSKAVNKNLNYFFKNVLKFQYDAQTESQINALPLSQDKLIRDRNRLWFTSIFDTIPLNLRSINYGKEPDTYYELRSDGKLVSKSTDGNNFLPYSLLEGKDSVTLDLNLISNSNIIDNQKVLLCKRDVVNMENMLNDIYFSSPNGHTGRNYQSGVFEIDNFTKYEDWSYFEYIFPIVRDQIIYIEAEISNTKHYSPDNIDTNGDNHIDYCSRVCLGPSGSPRVGLDVGIDDDDFYKVDFTMPTNLYFTADWADNMPFVLPKIYFETVGVSTGRYKNVIIRNITDTDNDGVIDFQDKCPTEYGEYEGCPDLQTSVPETKECEINIYPNPAGSIINIQACDEGELVIFDLMGNPLIKYEINDSNTQIDIAKLSQGTYSVLVKSKDQVVTKKFIKL